MLPDKSPKRYRNTEVPDSSSDSLIDHSEFGIMYPNKLKKDLFYVRVFNGNLSETKDDAFNHYKQEEERKAM